jgi:hypothetical protein
LVWCVALGAVAPVATGRVCMPDELKARDIMGMGGNGATVKARYDNRGGRFVGVYPRGIERERIARAAIADASIGCRPGH